MHKIPDHYKYVIVVDKDNDAAVISSVFDDILAEYTQYEQGSERLKHSVMLSLIFDSIDEIMFGNPAIGMILAYVEADLSKHRTVTYTEMQEYATLIRIFINKWIKILEVHGLITSTNGFKWRYEGTLPGNILLFKRKE